MKDVEVLKKFLSFPLWGTDDLFDLFSTLPGAILREDLANPKARFLYREGSRSNKVVLIAHADTVWDLSYHGTREDHEVIEEEGILKGSNPKVGLGADDRAGCAMLWLLRDSGHSILLTDGEERGKLGSNWLMDEYPDIASQLNQHQFMIQLDRQSDLDFKCYDVGTDAFRAFIQEKTNYTEPNRKNSTDIVTLCTDICGVNLSVGYYEEHHSTEHLRIDAWLHTLSIVRELLNEANLPRFELADTSN